MGALRKAGVWLGLVEDDDEDVYDEPEPPVRERGRGFGRLSRRSRRDDDLEADLDEDEEEDLRPTRGRGSRSVVTGRDREAVHRSRGGPEERGTRRDGTVSYLGRDNLALAPEPEPVAEPETPPAPKQRYQITTLHPVSYREARTIGEHFREGRPVIMNLTEMDEADARRLVDFGAGLAFGLRGKMERVTNRVFLLSPANVEVTPEDKARIAEGGFFRRR